MAYPTDMYDLKPILPGSSTSGPVGAAENHPDAAAAARSKIEQLHNLNPSVTPQTIIKTSAGLAPRPVSPSVQYQAKAKRNRPRSSRTKPLISAVLSFIFLLTFFKSGVLLSQLRYVTAKPAPQQTVNATLASQTVGADPVIIIPKINVNAPVVYEPSYDETKIQKALESGVVHYGNTALPGQAGNNVIVGHSSNDWWEPGNFKFVFVLLDKLVPGDTININYQSKQYTYTVTELKVVEPTDLSVLTPTDTPTLTLITCTPPGTSWKRLIVKAKQTSPDPSKTITPAPTQTAKTNQLPSNSPSLLDQLSAIWRNLTGGTKPTTTPDTQTPSTQSTPTGLPGAK